MYLLSIDQDLPFYLEFLTSYAFCIRIVSVPTIGLLIMVNMVKVVNDTFWIKLHSFEDSDMKNIYFNLFS